MTPIDCSIVIPSRNRPDFFHRCLKFIYESELSAPVIFVDNSEADYTPRYLAIVDEYQKAGMDLTYIRPEKRYSLISYILEGLLQTKTQYAAFLSDDDLISMNFLSAATEFLDSNPDYTSVTGQIIYFSIAGDTQYGPCNRFRYGQGFSQEEDDILSRIHNNEMRYSRDLSTYLAFDHVRRTKDWISIMKIMDEVTNLTISAGERDEYGQANAVIDEYFMTPMALCNGKVKNLPMMNIALQAHKQQTGAFLFSEEDVITGLESSKWHTLFTAYLDKVAHYVSEKSGHEYADVEKLLHTLAWKRFTHFIHKGSRARYYQIMQRYDFMSRPDAQDPTLVRGIAFFRRGLDLLEAIAKRKQISVRSYFSRMNISTHDKESEDRFVSFVQSSPSTALGPSSDAMKEHT